MADQAVTHVIGNARMLLPDNADMVSGTIRFSNMISDISKNTENTDIDHYIDAGNKIIMPGIVDLGVFAVDKPAFHFGGITRAAIMPDQARILDDPALVERTAKGGKPDLWVHPIAAATQGLNSCDIAEIGLMQTSGAKAVATGRHWIKNSGTMLKILQYCNALNLTLITHSEDFGLTEHAVSTASLQSSMLGLPSAPAQAEAMAIARDLHLVEICGAPLHFRQVTTKAGFDLIRRAKTAGLPVTCGITPAHLFLSETAIGNYRSFSRISPPLRSEDDRLAAIDAIRDGTIDVVSSGHDPRGPEDKRLPFADARPGMAGAETLLPLALNLVRDGHIGFGRLAALLCENPAQILGVNAGKIALGAEADLILVDPDAPWQIDTAKMAAYAGNTPFDGLPVQGKVLGVWKGGQRLR